MIRRFTFLAAAAACMAGAAFAHEFTLGDLTIGHPYSYETPTTAKAAAGYLSITNAGAQADRLIAVRSDFDRAEIHTTETADGVTKMKEAGPVEIPAGATLTFAPGGYHVMFMGNAAGGLKDGATIPATLVFEKAGEIGVTFNVEPRAQGDKGTDHSAH